MTCGRCQQTFPLEAIVAFMNHKKLGCQLFQGSGPISGKQFRVQCPPPPPTQGWASCPAGEGLRWTDGAPILLPLSPLRVEPRRGLGLPVLGQGLEVGRGLGSGGRPPTRCGQPQKTGRGFAIHPQFGFTSPSPRTEIAVQVTGLALAVEGPGEGGDSGLREGLEARRDRVCHPYCFDPYDRAVQSQGRGFWSVPSLGSPR